MPPRIHYFQPALPAGARRRATGLSRILPACGLLLAATACSLLPGRSTPAPDPDRPRARPGATRQPEAFSSERAWAHLVALSGLGPRPTGSTANAEAREYIRTRLTELDLEVFDLELSDEPETASEEEETAEGPEAAEAAEPPSTVRHVAARIPGASPDSVLLMAHFDTRPGTPGANDGASGPAVLLELTRQLVARPLPYTVEVVFIDGDMGADEDDPTAPTLEGSQRLVDYLVEAGTLDVVRLAVVLRQVGDADLTIGRDLHSHRIHRETFFDVAEDLGYADVFPADRGFVESRSSHRPFVEVGMPRIVVLHDPWYGGEEPPGEYWGGEYDTREHCSQASLEAVGVVTLAALREISARLQKVDLVSGRAARREAEQNAPAELTGEPVAEEPATAPEEAAMPAEATAAPAEETAMPAEEGAAPAEETAMPADEEPAPMDAEATGAPVEQEPAPMDAEAAAPEPEAPPAGGGDGAGEAETPAETTP